MADISITAANVAAGARAQIDRGANAGETITAGMGVYQKSTDGKWYKMQSDGTAEEAGVGVKAGIALHGSLNGQPLAVQTSGQITIGATITAAGVYIVSATAGGIAPVADIVSTNKLTILGYGYSTTVLELIPTATGIALA